LIVLAGGDGTFSCAAEAVAEAGLPLGLIPSGTANDLARTLDVPTDLAAACEVIAGGHFRRVDLGVMNGKPFFNVAHIGFGVAVARNQTDDRKKRFGVASYLLSVRDAIAAHEPFWCEIVCDGRRERHRLDQLTVGNGRHYGGGLTISADARIDDGMLDLYAIPPLPWWRALTLLPRLRAGPRRHDRGGLLMRGAEIEVHTEPTLPVDIDGEVEGATPARFSVLPGALRIFTPAASRANIAAEGEVIVLRDPAEAALNAVLMTCDEVAEEHAKAADMLGDGPDADMLRQAARRRRENAAQLRRVVRAHGDLPRAAHGERELVREGLAHIKALLADDRRRGIMADQANSERRLMDMCAAMPGDGDAACRALVAALYEDATATERALRAAAGDPS
jgi:YegS/Rv2252/BmrU family lipid kinase